MKRLSISALAAIALASPLMADTQIQISGTTGVLSNLTIAGNNTQRLVWGLIIDSGANGFQGLSGNGLYLGNNTMFAGPQTVNATVAPPVTLSITNDGGTTVTPTDDYLWLAPQVFSIVVAPNFDGATTLARPGAVTGNYTGAMGLNDPFAIVWFDLDEIDLGTTNLTATANANVPRLNAGLAYGALTNGSFLLPADGGGLVSFQSLFTGADPLRNATYTLQAVIPEPSSALLLIGAGSLLLARRRRQA